VRFLGSSPLATLVRGALAGLAGTGAMTFHQELRSRAKGGGGSGGEPSWDEAPAPAVVAKRLLEGLFQRDVPPSRIPLLANAMHWVYGTAWGIAYALAAESGARMPGPAFGAAVWGMQYVQLVPMGLYELPWHYGLATLADDLGYHVTYGTATALAHRAVS
jgi:hypothetical protein